MDPKDRRKHPRFEGQFPVDLLNMGDDPAVSTFQPVVEATALDISRQGMRLKADYDVAVGTVLSVVAYFKNHESVCLCEVVWKRGDDKFKLYGLYIQQWTTLDPALEKRLADMERREKAADHSDFPTAHAVVTNC